MSQFRESTINAGSTPPKPEVSEQLFDKYLLAADCRLLQLPEVWESLKEFKAFTSSKLASAHSTASSASSHEKLIKITLHLTIQLLLLQLKQIFI